MSETPEAYDALIIGAGVIGAAIAHELAGRGWKTLTVDKAASAGAGSTINSCAIVRFSYSSVEGTNLRGRACTTGRTGRRTSAPTTSSG